MLLTKKGFLKKKRVQRSPSAEFLANNPEFKFEMEKGVEIVNKDTKEKKVEKEEKKEEKKQKPKKKERKVESTSDEEDD